MPSRSSRFNDYLAASIPVLRSSAASRWPEEHILLYILAFLVATLMLTFSGYAGMSYLAVAAAMGMYWLYMAWTEHKAVDDTVLGTQAVRVLDLHHRAQRDDVDFQVPRGSCCA